MPIMSCTVARWSYYGDELTSAVSKCNLKKGTLID